MDDFLTDEAAAEVPTWDYVAEALDADEQRTYDRLRAIATGLPERPGTLR